MNIVDFLIIMLIIVYIAKGFKNGALKEIATFAGSIVVLVIAYILKNPLSVYMYQNFPFIKFSGALAGISVLNIIVYELIAFLVVAGVLFMVYRLILMFTNVLETILKATIILEIPSKIIGLIVGFVEGVVICFLFLFVMMQFDTTREYITSSKYGDFILSNTPVLSKATDSIYSSLKEIYAIADEYKDSTDKSNANLKALEVLLRYKVIEPSNASVLVTTGKLDFPGAKELVDAYYEVNPQ